MAPRFIRNIAIIAHDGAGKTALTEALVRHDAPARASKGGSTSRLDADPEEAKRNFTVATHITYAEHDGVLLNLLDTAGFSDFLTDADRSMAVCEGGLLLVSAVSGVKHQTGRHWEMAAERSLPLLACVNKLDRERASFLRALDDLEKSLGARPVALQLPIGLGDSFTGVVDLLSMRAHVYARREDGRFGGYVDEPIPRELVAQAQRLRTRLVEAVAETDDLLQEKYLDGAEPTFEQLRDGIAHAVLGRRFLPVVACAARPGVGVRDVAQAMVDFLPNPLARREVRGRDAQGKEQARPARAEAPTLLLAFRSTAEEPGRLTALRVFSGALAPGQQVVNARTGRAETIDHLYRIDGHRTVEVAAAAAGDIVGVLGLKDVRVGDAFCDAAAPLQLDLLGAPRKVITYALKIDRDHEAKVAAALHRLLEEDPSLEVVRDEETGETLLKAMGQVHVEVAVEKLKRKFDAEVHLELPHPAYHETLTVPARAKGRYKRTSGGRCQFGECVLELSPLPAGSGVQFEDALPRGTLPRGFVPAVEQGVRAAAAHGPLGQFPLVDFKARLVGGHFHTVDSTELAFRVAAAVALRNGLPAARPALLEPVMRLEVVVPDDVLAEVIGDLGVRRGKILGLEQGARGTVLQALAPQAELRTYAQELRALTRGQGYFTMELQGYERVPHHESQRVLAQRHAELGRHEPVPNQPGKGRA